MFYKILHKLLVYFYKKENILLVKVKEPIGFDELREKLIHGMPKGSTRMGTGFIYNSGEYIQYTRNLDIFVGEHEIVIKKRQEGFK